jgi:hypothetical protein
MILLPCFNIFSADFWLTGLIPPLDVLAAYFTPSSAKAFNAFFNHPFIGFLPSGSLFKTGLFQAKAYGDLSSCSGSSVSGF